MNAEDTVRNLWATRPRRPKEDRKVAGVAAAIGHRYAIDPVLVRVAFIVATLFSGAGILIYLLGWLLFPGEGDEVSAAEGLLGQRHSSVSSALTVVLGLALIPAIGIVFSGDAYGVIGLAIAAVGIFLLHRSRAALGQVPVPVAGGTDSAGGTPAGEPAATDPVIGVSASQHPPPPASTPLSAAPVTGDQPTPGRPQQSVRSRAPRSKVTPITLGLALLVGGIVLAFWPALSLTHVVALVLGVIGLGLVAGSLVRGGRGLIVVAVPLALLVWVLHTVPVSDARVGEGVWTPATSAQVQPRYAVTMGTSRLDLTAVRVPDGQTVRTAVTVGLGEAQVTLPRNVDTQVVCRVPVGSAECLGVTSSGIPAEVTRRDVGADGPGGGTLILDVRSGVGDVHVMRTR